MWAKTRAYNEIVYTKTYVKKLAQEELLGGA